eukprot:6474874-Amphidinium_carterae.1
MHQAPAHHEGSIPLDADGFKQLIGINGNLSWLAINTRPDIQAQVSSSIKQASTISLKSKAIPESHLVFGAFADASLATHPEDNSQGGCITVSLVGWKSWKLKHSARSSLSAEIQALSEGVDDLQFTRLFWHGLTHPEPLDLQSMDTTLNKSRAFAITDCRSFFDAINPQESSTLGWSEIY